MAKKNKKDKEAKKARAELKNKKNLEKAEVKDKKRSKKLNSEDDDDLDIDEILENFRKEQELFQEVVVTPVKRPSPRSNVCMVPNPSHGKRELLIFGGEYTNQTSSTTTFYNELFTYSLDTDQWKKITSRNAPMPRSSAAAAGHPSGVVLIHGGEFSSPKQNTFYHYSDSWLLDCSSKEWTKIDQKNGPSARSGHRMTVWKNFFVMHGGFRDLGTSTTYLNDCWLFDITTYKWKQVEFPPNHPVPDARSGHSLIPTQEGAIVWGGYCKIKAKKGLQKGKILTDCWYLRMKSDITGIRWERRKKQGFQPSPRVGCSMAHHKGRGILFGGVYDYEETEEGLSSEFFNDLLSYQVEANRWYSIKMRPQKKKIVAASKSAKSKDDELVGILNDILQKANLADEENEENESDSEIEKELHRLDEEELLGHQQKQYPVVAQLPHSRFNAATTVVDDTLFIFGGSWEYGERDFSIDSFYSIDLNRTDGVRVFWEDLEEIEKAKDQGLEEDEEEEEEEDDDDEDDEEETLDEELIAEMEDDKQEEEEQEEEEEEEEAGPEIPDPRPWLPHPKAFETLRAFYIRTGAEFLQWAISNNRSAKGKHLKKQSFDLSQDRWWERREQVRIEEDKLEEMGGVENIIERDSSHSTKRR
ncbi:Kel3p [Lachancea thermotolerans CBS 6340]|uniref:KLTH0C11528p n=1 Tax=Lachancea thermotolerans (strain ATCC 56472 / CBS 6340 / NRRL Y-8284) TaxID=559295 RepID=C5DER7_LACTC|nr:KLTH0C11528p [Lachancea thermotolerans CBS 6340]CAR22278.1 KLTH0C11528p [Lachancea thermotolerans CBS 6340]